MRKYIREKHEMTKKSHFSPGFCRQRKIDHKSYKFFFRLRLLYFPIHYVQLCYAMCFYYRILLWCSEGTSRTRQYPLFVKKKEDLISNNVVHWNIEGKWKILFTFSLHASFEINVKLNKWLVVILLHPFSSPLHCIHTHTIFYPRISYTMKKEK